MRLQQNRAVSLIPPKEIALSTSGTYHFVGGRRVRIELKIGSEHCDPMSVPGGEAEVGLRDREDRF